MSAIPIPVEDFRLAGCAGKDALTRQHARQIVDRMNMRPRGTTKPNAYKCFHCGSWHVGARR